MKRIVLKMLRKIYLLLEKRVDHVAHRLQLGVLDQFELVDKHDEVAEARVDVRLGSQRHNLIME